MVMASRVRSTVRLALVGGTMAALLGVPTLALAAPKTSSSSCPRKGCPTTTTTAAAETTTTEAPATTTTAAPATTTTTAPTTTTTAAPVQEPSTAPDGQGTWTSPEGVRFEVATSASWTIRQIHSMVVASALDLDQIGPGLTVKVQDATPTQAVASVSGTSLAAVIYLQGTASGFQSAPDATVAHEYGHVWSTYHLQVHEGGDWSGYLRARGLEGDTRLDSSYTWSRDEIIADDYRLLFGSSLAISQRNGHMNWNIPDPRTVSGLRDFLAGPFRV